MSSTMVLWLAIASSNAGVRPVPDVLLNRPFTTQEARRCGVTDRMLQGPRFRRLHRGVYVASAFAPSHLDLIEAARLAVPDDARLSHVSRLQHLGLTFGPTDKIHFTVARDLHVTPRGVFVHRTEVMPATDEVGVTPAAGFIGYGATSRLLDLARVGDWLLANRHASVDGIRELSVHQPWRPGARAALIASRLLDGRSASFPETDCRIYLLFAGLPVPEVNVPVLDDANSPIADLVLQEYRLCIEHEGRHHFSDPDQVTRDVWRYAVMRDAGYEYVQVHRDILRRPKAYVLLVHRKLVERGYQGPPPRFGRRWDSLFRPVRDFPSMSGGLSTKSKGRDVDNPPPSGWRG